MKAWMYEGPWQMRVVDVPEPSPAADEVKIRVKYCGICGSDIHGYTGASGRKIPPMIMGHEFSGTVAETGSDVRGFAPGQRVVVLPVESCHQCEMCRQGKPHLCRNRRGLGVLDVDGAFTQYICVKAEYVYPLPETVSDLDAALLEPLAVAYHAVSEARPVAGKNVLLVGADTIGELILQCLSLEKPAAVVVSDLSEAHRAAALQNGATAAIDPAAGDLEGQLEALGLRDRIDVAMEAVGASATVQQTIDLTAAGGRVVWVGNAAKMVDVGMQSIVTREISIRGSYAYTPEDFAACIDLLAQGKLPVRKIVSDVIPFQEIDAVMNKMATKELEPLKIVAEIGDSILQ